MTSADFYRSVEVRLALLSAFLYSWAYSLEVGYCSYFGIPAKVIDISITDVVRSGLAGLFLLLIGALILDFVPRNGSHLARRKKIAVYVLAYGLVFGPFIILEFGLTAVIVAFPAFVLLVILGGWTQDFHAVLVRRFNQFLGRGRAGLEKEIAVPPISEIDSGDLAFLFFALWMVLYAVAFGHAIAKQQQKFLETSLAPGVVFMEKYGDLWVGKTIENGQWGVDTTVLKLGDGQTTFREIVREGVYSSHEFRWKITPSVSEKK